RRRRRRAARRGLEEGGLVAAPAGVAAARPAPGLAGAGGGRLRPGRPAPAGFRRRAARAAPAAGRARAQLDLRHRLRGEARAAGGDAGRLGRREVEGRLGHALALRRREAYPQGAVGVAGQEQVDATRLALHELVLLVADEALDAHALGERDPLAIAVDDREGDARLGIEAIAVEEAAGEELLLGRRHHAIAAVVGHREDQVVLAHLEHEAVALHGRAEEPRLGIPRDAQGG